MRRLFLLTAVGLGLAVLAGAARAGDKAKACGSFGTAVEFVDTPSEAAKLAKKEQKLVFVLHVSGHFEDPTFT